MSRSLNPQLFGPTEKPSVRVEGKLQPDLKKIAEVEAQMSVLDQKLERWAKILDTKMQHLSSSQKNLGEQMKQIVEGFSEQLAHLHGKINERRTADIKTQEMIDRHNQLVNSFEVRIAQIQRLTSEQEMKLMTYQASYNEVIREIRNLK